MSVSPKPEEVVGLIGQADEAAGESADAALQADGLFALFLQLEHNVDGALLGVALDLRLFGFDFVEIIQLVEAKNAQFPGALIEDLAFVEQQFAADDFVAGGGVAAEIDAADKVLLLFVEIERQIDDFGVVVDIRNRVGSEIDEAVLAVSLL